MSAVLAQLNFQEANIPPLPAAPALERFGLENPIPGVIIFAGLAVALFFVLNARGKIKAAVATAACFLLLAAGLSVLASLVETDRETIAARTRELVAAVARADRAEMDRLLADELTMRASRVPPNADKEVVIATVERVIGELYRVQDHDILDLQAAMYGPRVGRTQTRVRASSDMGVIPSWWRIDWQRTDDEWRAVRIEALWIPGVPNPGG